MSDAGQAEGLESEITRLRAERDELAREAERLDRRVNGGVVRHAVVGLLVVLTCVSFFAATTGVWVNRNLLQTDVWVERVGPLASDPAVQRALAAEITDQVMQTIDPQALFEEALPERGQILAGPLSSAVRTFVADAVTRFVESDAFAELWVGLNERGHAAAVAVLRGEDPSPGVQVDDGTVTVSIIPAIDAVLARLSQVSPEIFGKTITLPTLTVEDLPDAAREEIADALGITLDEDFGVITVFDSDALSTSQTALKLFDDLLVPAIVLTLALIPVTLLISRRRRRTALQLLVGGALAMVLLRRISLRLVGDVVDLAQIPGNQAALESILHAFLDPLLAATQWILIGFAIVAAILLLSGPYRWSRAIRRGVTGLARGTVAVAGSVSQGDGTVTWVRDHALALQWAGAAVFLAGLWWLDLTWLSGLLLLAVIGGFELWVAHLAADVTDAPPDAEDAVASTDDRSPPTAPTAPSA